MFQAILRTACAAVLATGLVASSGSAQSGAAVDNVRLVFDINFRTRTGNWVSSGAFSDEGIIANVAKHDPNGQGTLAVVETLSGNRGSFTWKFTRNFQFVPGESRTAGAWQMISGTGAYSGITGQGKFEGTINSATGEIHDIFTGHVNLTPCRTDPGTGIQVCTL
jgi:hypothetical protein